MFMMKFMLRQWRSGELGLLAISIVLAVAVLSSIALFANRLESTLLQQSNALQGADRVVTSSRDIAADWQAAAQSAHIRQSRTIEFNSMAYAGDEMNLAAVKAVEKGYPLRGHVEVSQQLFAVNPADILLTAEVPAVGEVWVDSRLLASLKLPLGGQLAIGEKTFRVAKILVREPESANPFANFAPRVLMNLADVPATQVIQPGSQVVYGWLLAQDNQKALIDFMSWLKPQLSQHEKIIDFTSAQERLSSTLTLGKNFLLLAAVMSILLAGVAIAIAARQYAQRHTTQVALLKSFGVSAGRVRRLYVGQVILIGALASLIGLLLGDLIQQLVAWGLRAQFQLELQAADFFVYGFSVFSGLLTMLFFALPPLWFLPRIPPLKILRHELAEPRLHTSVQWLLAVVAIALLVALFSGDFKLTLMILGVLLAVIVLSVVLSTILLAISRQLMSRLGGRWRLAFANLSRHKGQTLLQISLFSIAMMLLLTLTIIRTSVIAEWQRQLPLHAPNHFIVNVPPSELDQVQAQFGVQHLASAPFYPMIRGRLVAINQIAPSDDAIKKANALQREVNLTQSATMGSDNSLQEGAWWDKWQEKTLPGVSVESGTAKNLGLKLGDQLRFSIGGLRLDVEVASIRRVEWKSMQPNFFFIFQPGTLDNYSPTYMTSVYLSPAQKPFIAQLLHGHPTLVVIELDRLLEQMQKIIDQVSNAIGLVLLLTLAAGVLVLLAAVMSSIDARRQEAGLVRALGASRGLLLGSLWAEFSLLGCLAGVIAIAGAEGMLFALQTFLLRTPLQAHYVYWLLSPLLGATLIGVLGAYACRSVVVTPPMQVLREAT